MKTMADSLSELMTSGAPLSAINVLLLNKMIDSTVQSLIICHFVSLVYIQVITRT